MWFFFNLLLGVLLKICIIHLGLHKFFFQNLSPCLRDLFLVHNTQRRRFPDAERKTRHGRWFIRVLAGWFRMYDPHHWTATFPSTKPWNPCRSPTGLCDSFVSLPLQLYDVRGGGGHGQQWDPRNRRLALRSDTYSCNYWITKISRPNI